MAKTIEQLTLALTHASYNFAKRIDAVESKKAVLDAENAIKTRFAELQDRVSALNDKLGVAEDTIRQLTPPAKPTEYVSFDKTKVAVGDEIEFKHHLPGGVVWRVTTFLAVTSRGNVVAEDAEGRVQQHSFDDVRVAKKTRNVQVFANMTKVCDPSNGMCGAIFLTADQAKAWGEHAGADQLAAIAAPVTITVVE